MKILNYSIMLTMMYSCTIFTASKIVTLSIKPSNTIDMSVKINRFDEVKGGIVSEKIIIPAGKSVKIALPDNGRGTIDFWIAPAYLSEYVGSLVDSYQKDSTKKAYNFNAELDRPGQKARGAERLFQALATSLKLPAQDIGSKLVLPNPMQVLELLK